MTLGGNMVFTPRMTNEVRVNYGYTSAQGFYTFDNFGGATPPPDSVLYPSFATPQRAAFLFVGDTSALEFYAGTLGDAWQRQVNVTDNLSRTIGGHQMKFGADYRRITSKTGPYSYISEAVFLSLSNVLTNTMPAGFRDFEKR